MRVSGRIFKRLVNPEKIKDVEPPKTEKMADNKKQTLQLGNTAVEVSEVAIARRIREEPNEYELEDGSIIRVSNPTTVVLRIEGQTDNEGSPGYFVKNGTAVTVVLGPRKLD